MKYLILISFLFVVRGSDVIQYNPSSSPITNQVTAYYKSVNTPDYDKQSNTLINPIVPTNGAFSSWKVTGTNVVEMSKTETDSITATNILLNTLNNKTNILNIYVRNQQQIEQANKLAIDSILEILAVQINAIRTNPITVLPVILDTDAKSQFITTYSNKVNALP
jgi:hypothetical protein